MNGDEHKATQGIRSALILEQIHLTKTTPKTWAVALSALCVLLFVVLGHISTSYATPVLLLTDGADADPSWIGSWASAMEEQGYPVACSGNKPWPGDPLAADLQEAQNAYDEGLNLFLDLDIKGASKHFKDAYERFDRLLRLHPFHRVSSEGSSLSGFYWARTLVQRNDRRGATRILTDFIAEHPTAVPEPSIFPPAFRQLVEAVKNKRNRRGASDLTVELTPFDASVTLGDVVLRPGPDGTVTLPELGHGSYRLAVGMPGLGMREQTIQLGSSPTVRINLLEPPKGIVFPELGRPWPTNELGSVVRTLGRGDTLIWISDARSIGLPSDWVAYIQDVNTGRVTGAIVVAKRLSPRRAATALASATIAALNTNEVEVFRATSSGVVEDEATQQTVLQAIGVQNAPPLENITPGDSDRTMSLGVHLGTGIGLAVHVSQPGFAPTPALVRPDIAFALSDNIDLGLGARVQISKTAVLGEPYVQWRAGIVRLRGGIAIGQISQTITDTENRDRSTQKWVGPSAGLGVMLGPVQLSTGAITTLFPDQSVQFDALLGIVFDL